MGVGVYGCKGVRVCECMSVAVWCKGVCVQGCKVYEFINVRGARVRGNTGARVYEREGVRVCECISVMV